MNCTKFPDRPAAGKCAYSGKPYCQEELVEISGKMISKDNVEKYIAEQRKIDGVDKPASPNPMVFMNAGGGGGGGASSSSSSSAAASGGTYGFFHDISCLDWILIVATSGLWLIVIWLRRKL